MVDVPPPEGGVTSTIGWRLMPVLPGRPRIPPEVLETAVDVTSAMSSKLIPVCRREYYLNGKFMTMPDSCVSCDDVTSMIFFDC